MSSSQLETIWKSSSTFSQSSSTTGKILIPERESNGKSSWKKTSVEDLEDQGFRIGSVLGEGSYCKVKKANYKGNDMAVKIITRDDLSLDFESRFLPREIDILSKIEHKNIIHVHKIFSYPRRVYIFMELIQRGDLLCFVRKRSRLMEGEAYNYFQQMVSAIQYLHSLNIAHRDLKCENIMITEQDVIKIIDFGFCRSTVNKHGHRELSRTYCGSTGYAAPEVLQGVPYNPMMYDVWSLGCVLFIMVTGTMPFDDSNVRKMVTCQLKRQYRYPSTFIVSKQVRKIISRMLEPDVTRRATMNQVSRSPWLQDNKYEPDQTHSLPSRHSSMASSLLTKNNFTVSRVSTETETKDLVVSGEFNIFEQAKDPRNSSRKG